MPIRRRLALYGAAVAAAGMFPSTVRPTGLAATGIRDDQDGNLTAIADTAATALERGDAGATGGRPLVVVDLAKSAEPFVLVLAGDGTVRYASGLLNGAPPRIPAAVVVEATEQGRSVATISALGVASIPGTDAGLRVVGRKFVAGGGGIVVAGQS